MLLSDRTKVVRTVMGFLALCALVGFAMGLKSALPRNVDEGASMGPPAEATSNVVVEASPVQDTPPVANEPAANEEAATNADEKQAEEEKVATKAEETKPVQPAPAAPPEEAPTNDAVGQILDQQQQQNTAAPPNLY